MRSRLRVLTIIKVLLLAAGGAILAQAQGHKEDIRVRVNSRELHIRVPTVLGATSNEVAQLIADRIKRAVLADSVKKEGIRVQAETISNAMDMYFTAGPVSAETVRRLAEHYRAIVAALRSVVAEKQDPKRVYTQVLMGVLSRRDWRIYVKEYNTPGKIRKLERSIPRSVANMKENSRPEFTRTVQTWLLLERLLKGVSPSHEEVLAAYKQMYPSGNPPLHQVEAKVLPRAIREAKRRCLAAWWNQQISRQRISVPEPYRGQVDTLLKRPPWPPFLPAPVQDLLRRDVGGQ